MQSYEQNPQKTKQKLLKINAKTGDLVITSRPVLVNILHFKSKATGLTGGLH